MTHHFTGSPTAEQMERARAIDPPWRHHFHFGAFDTGGLWDERHMDFIDRHTPPVLGRSVLDVGTCDGYYAFRAEALGAREVVGIDPVPRPAFEMAKEILGSAVEYHQAVLGDWDDDREFELVLCLGVFYHVPDVLGLLEECAMRTAPGGYALFEGPVAWGRLNRYVPLPPIMQLAPDPQYQPNVWLWRPSVKAMRAMLGMVGYEWLGCRFMWGRALITARMEG